MLALLTLLLACGERPTLPGAGPSFEGPPDLLIITMDTTRADALEPYGAPVGSSPRIAALAAEGAVFERAYTVTPLTIPAHSSLFTGQFPPRHGVRDNGDFFLGPEVNTLAERLKGRGYATMASVGAEVTSHHWGFAQGFDAYYDDMGIDPDARGNRWRIERRGDKVIADAAAWLRQNKDQRAPLFSWVHLFDVHHPYEAPEPYASRFRRPYAAEVAWTDAQIGDLLDLLQEIGRLDRTWIFLMADHGEGLGSHGEAMHGVLLYNATMHIPLIIRPPARAAAGRRLSFPSSIVDITPTVLGLVGLPVDPQMDGIDLGPWLKGEAAAPPADRAVYMESLYAWHHYGWAPQRALATQDHHLIDSTTPELYAAADLLENENITAIREPIVAQLQARTAELYASLAPSGAAARASLSADQQAQLEALGYMTTSAPNSEGGPPFGAGLPDPVNHLPVLKEVEKARQLLQRGEVPAAKAALEAIIQKEPTLVDPQATLAGLYVRAGEQDKAFALLTRLDSMRPSGQIKMMLGNLHMQRRELSEASDFFAAAVELDPYSTGAWTAYLGALLMGANPRRFQAEAARAMEKLPENSSIRGMRGVAFAMDGQMELAEPLLREALTRDPNLPFLNHALGVVARAREQLDQAEQFYLEEVRLHPPAVTTRRQIIEILAEQKRYEEQLAELEALAPLEPPNHSSAHSKAQVLFNLKRYAEAEPEVQRCMQLSPDYAPCVMLNANVLKKLGREKEGYAEYERALKMVGQSPPAPPATP